MSSQSSWFWCGVCGFRNHPRLNGKDALEQSRVKGSEDTAVCEQCGAGNSHPEAKDAEPGV